MLDVIGRQFNDYLGLVTKYAVNPETTEKMRKYHPGIFNTNPTVFFELIEKIKKKL